MKWNTLSHLDHVIWRDPVVGNQHWPKSADGEDALVSARRRIMMTAMQELSSALKDAPGRKNLFFFTGNLRCEMVGTGLGGCSLIKAAFPNSNEFLCGLMDTLEQGRIWAYLDYGRGHMEYGFGCRSTGAPLQGIQSTSAQYYTLYYTPTNQDWNGEYRKTTVEAKKKGLQLAYRGGYNGAPENAEAHYYTAKKPAGAPVPAVSNGPTITATTVVAGTAGSDGGDGSAKTPPNPTAAIFSVQVVPAAAPSADSKAKQEYRKLTLHFSMPASEFKVVPFGASQYAARLEISAMPYANGKALETYESEVVANFTGADDPRIATSTISATLTLNIAEHGGNRWLDVGVRDMATGQFGSLAIPMEQVKMPGTQ